MTLRHAVLLVLLASPVVARTPPPAPNWRAIVTDVDRGRLRVWREAFAESVAQARESGAGAEIDRAGALLRPDAGLGRPLPPAGDYRCRVIKLGAPHPAGLPYIAYGWFSCRIGPMRAGAAAFAKLDGSQRPVGMILDDGRRGVFVGAIALGDERRALPYGRDRERDMVGAVERIGPARWRILFPQPRWESLMDVMELSPKAAAR